MVYGSRTSTNTEVAVILGERGRMVLPAPVRERLDLRGGERFLVRVEDDGSIRLVSYRSIAERNRGMFATLAPGRPMVDELIAERRAEAAREGSK